jgi:carbon-monoxide dehydrogenase large subunit
VTANSFKTYLMPRANDVPAFELWHHEVPSPNTLLGTKGAGEAGIGGALAAIANAVYDAAGRPRTADTAFPLTPPDVLKLMSAGLGR